MPCLLATAGPPGWTLDPAVLLSLALVAHLYARGLRRLWRSGAGRGVRRWQAAAFGGGILSLVAALVSPLDPLSDRLASAHMVQHMLLMNVAAPLLVLGAPSLVVLSGVPAPYRGPLARAWRRVDGPWLWNPFLLGTLYALVLWVWHLPALYGAALRDPVVHDLEHLTFLVAACLFWRAVLDPLGRRRLHPLASLLYLFVTTLHATALGMFMALSPRVWYPDYEGPAGTWGLTALEDQQLAGLIMWMPACVVYAGVAAGRLVAWIGEQE
jgi:cytochrome c oxidase assembly factor CtaG